MAMAASKGPLTSDEIFDIVKRNDQAHFDLVYQTLLINSTCLCQIPKNETHSILHYIVLHGAYDLFNKVLAIPNIRLILLTKTLSKPSKDILQIADEKKGTSKIHKKLYEDIKHLNDMDRLVELGKINDINECKKMLTYDPDLINHKPPYRKYYLVHHLAYSNNKDAFDELNKTYKFDLTLLTSDRKTASEVAFEQNHARFAHYLEKISPQMKQIREEHEQAKQKAKQTTAAASTTKKTEELEQQIASSAGTNVLDCFTCPLTREVFRDPVVLSDGFTYEREAIQKWLDLGNRRSPMTNMELTDLKLRPNNAIKQAIEALAQKEKK